MVQIHNENEGVPGNLKKLLAVAVRSVQWSYAIFWSISHSTQQGVLEWGDGYYNGDFKTLKTYRAMEVVKADKTGLQRSKQLRDLYELLAQGDNTSGDEHATGPGGTSVSPEDLSDAEWFYLVCMSFVFSPGQGLPGRALAFDRPIWLCNAQYASRKVFTRSLLAKSASIQTVLCFPYLGGVMELGSTELVPEDPALILRVKTILLDVSKPHCYAEDTFSSYSTDNDEHPICVNAGNDNGNINTSRDADSAAEHIIEEDQEMSLDGPSEDSEDDFAAGSPDYCSFSSEQNHQSSVHSWHFMNEGDLSTDIQGSINSSNNVSQVLETVTKPKSGTASIALEPHENGNSADLHYRRAISAILIKSNLLTGSLGGRRCVRKSSFDSWKNIGSVMKRRPCAEQKILKKMLFAVPLMYSHHCVIKPEIDYKNAVSELRGETLLKLENERFFKLRSMLPSAGIEKASVLEDAIKYVQKLEARLGKLESDLENLALPNKEASEVHLNDMVEQTSEDSERKTFQLKRKACESEANYSLNVEINEQEVLIEIGCTWREYLLLDIIDTLNRLQLDAHSVQSSTLDDGAFTLKVHSKLRGMAVASAQVLKQAIWEIICH